MYLSEILRSLKRDKKNNVSFWDTIGQLNAPESWWNGQMFDVSQHQLLKISYFHKFYKFFNSLSPN